MKTTAPDSENLEVRSEKGNQDSSFSIPNSHFSPHPPALVPKVRFPEFREAEGWESGKVDDLVDTVTPPKKLPTALYASSGAFPIIDQSQSDICGWTDDNEALIRESLPLIVFGDHTCILKLIAKPFAQGADGIKILKTGPKLGTPYLYQFLSYQPVTTEEYKRHYAILKEKIIYFPEFKSGEQQKIAECLSSLDELMAAQARKVDALKTHKKGLMQQLFPREGETQPRLRFPEFQNAGEWEEDKLIDIATFRRGSFPQPYGLPEWYDEVGGMPFVQVFDVGDDFRLKERTKSKISKLGAEKSVFIPKGTLIVTLQGSIGRVAITHYDAYIDRTLLIFETFRKPVEKVFFARLIQNLFDIEKEIAPGGIIKTITKEALSDFKVKLPKIPEQQRIADCLSSLDALITAQTQKLAALKTHKQALMQQLFPASEEVAA